MKSELDDLSVRARNILSAMNLRTLEEVAGLSADQMLATRNCGYTVIAELRHHLAKAGLSFVGDTVSEGEAAGHATVIGLRRENVILRREIESWKSLAMKLAENRVVITEPQ